MSYEKPIREFLSCKRLAIAGVSQTPGDFSRVVFREFLARGYDVVPVNPAAESIEGCQCFRLVSEIQPPVDAVLVMTPPGVTESVVRDCAGAGVSRVWLFRGGGKGSVSEAAVRFCQEHGISVVPGECPLMFLEGAGFIHRVHKWFRHGWAAA